MNNTEFDKMANINIIEFIDDYIGEEVKNINKEKKLKSLTVNKMLFNSLINIAV